ncbi:hypothetical protein [Limnobacter sp.]|uniref:hypothetical protein n=1 Tax=Limnobacter sp. TaxID=2003368 RepID=UPI003747C11D
MFESIVLRKSEIGQNISAGHIAEALLYYQKVHLVLCPGTLIQLLKQIGINSTLSLLRRHDVSAVYCEETLGTKTEQLGVFQIHNYVAITLAGHKELEFPTTIDRLQYDLRRIGIEKTTAKHFSKAFLKIAPVRAFSGSHFIKAGVPKAAAEDLLDSEYAKKAARSIITSTPGGYDPGETLKFKVIKSDLGLNVLTDINFEAINANRVKLGDLDPITASHLLTALQDVRADLVLAAHYGGDFITSKQNSDVVMLRHAELLRRANINQQSLQQFKEIVLPDTPSLAEIIDSGQRTFDEFIRLLGKASKFKDWLKSTNPDEGLIREYLASANSVDWIQKTPTKTVRYLFSMGLDTTMPSASIPFGLFDNFIIEKLFAGWRPSHFVNKQLAQFSQTK